MNEKTKKRKFEIDIRDLFFVLGLVSMGIGLWMFEPAYAFLGVGSILLMVGVASAIQRRG